MHDPLHQEFFDIADLPAHYLKEVEHFFQIYKDLEGKRVEILGWEKSDSAMRLIEESIAATSASTACAATPPRRARRWWSPRTAERGPRARPVGAPGPAGRQR
jgi:hypothetical protein